MKTYFIRYIVFLLVILPIIFCSCGKTWYEYNIDRSHIRAVYLNQDIQALETTKTLEDKDEIFVDLRKFNGDQYSGLLKRIDRNNIVLAKSYIYTTKKDSVVKVENYVSIAKKDVAFLKIW